MSEAEEEKTFDAILFFRASERRQFSRWIV